MKNKAVKGLLCIFCLGSLYYANKSVQVEISDLAFENIEALAGGEGSGNYVCVGSGDVDCSGYKVREKLDNLSLKIE